MEQSAHVKEVLDSKQFRIWLPEKEVRFELMPRSDLGIATILSAGLASFCSMSTMQRDISMGSMLLRIFLLTLLFLMIYVGVAGFKNCRILKLDSVNLEIRSDDNLLLQCEWADILSVHRIGLKCFQVETHKG